jgi:hypothetical protein
LPGQHCAGSASRLLERVEAAALSEDASALLAKARPEALRLFESRGLEKLHGEDHTHDDLHRFLKHL